MLLAIDAGNTNIVFAVHDGRAFRHIWRVNTVPGKTADEYAALLFQLFGREGLDFNVVEGSLICSVVPDADEQLRQMCEKSFGSSPVFVDHKMIAPYLPVKLKEPGPVGADRLVNAMAVKQLYRSPAAVIDFGTATTFDIIDAKGVYIGGIIAPGADLSLSALHRMTAKLPKIDIRKPESVIGKDTVGAMQSGIYWGYIGLVEGIMARLGKYLPQKPFVVATGGLSGLYAQDLKMLDKVDKDLTLSGLVHIYQAYKEQSKVA